MVPVYSCHHFSSQEVFTSQYEPLAACSSKNLIFVATSRQTVEVHDMTMKGCPLLCTFSTVGIVIHMTHSDKGNFITTLESKSLKQKTGTSARVYINWARSAPWQPGRVRVAGHSLRNKKLSPKREQFEVIEIPTFKAPTSVKCCSLTGNIAISVDACICLFNFNQQGIDKITIDFEHVMNIDVGFRIIDLNICCNYVSCISQNEFRILKISLKTKAITDKTENDSDAKEDNLSNIKLVNDKVENSFFIEDENFVSWSFEEVEGQSSLQESNEQTSEFESLLAAVKLDNLSANKTCWMPSVKDEALFIDKSSTPIEILGPLKKVKGHPIKIDFPGNLSLGDENISDVNFTSLVYRCFEPGLENDMSLHSLKFCPTILKSESLKSDYYQGVPLAGLCCFVSTPTTGFLYEVYPKIRCLGTYPYTVETSLVAVGRDMVHAVTKNGLETYTSSIFAAALPNIEVLDGIVNVCPSALQEVSLIGLRPFIGIFDMVTVENNLIMLSKDSIVNSEGSWGVYVLKDPFITDLYSDIIDLASRHQQSNIYAYIFLLEQAHLLLRSAIFHSTHGKDYEMIEQFKETCKLLGDHYASPESEKPHLTIPYYNMSSKKLPEIIKYHYARKTKQEDKSECYGVGLLTYLNHHFFDQSSCVTLDETTADIVLNIYVGTQPEKLSSVILESKLEGYSLEGALRLMETLKTLQKKDQSVYIPTALDYICQAVMQLKLCEPDQARFLLNKISDDDFVKVFIQRPWLLSEEGQFSTLAQLMRQHNGKLFIDVLIALHDNKSVGLKKVLQLFQAQSSCINANSTHLRDYLEAILNSKQRRDSHEEAAILLAEIYIKRLMDWKPVQQNIARGRGHVHMDVNGYFGPRYEWLDNILPFVGTEALRKPCSKMRILDTSKRRPSRQMSKSKNFNKDCHCCCCYDDLIKAQSLLCTTSSDLGPHKLILDATSKTDFVGSESLKILCLARLDAGLGSSYLIEKYPDLVVPFVKDVFNSTKDLWTNLLEKLFEKIKTLKLEEDGNKNLKTYSEILKGVLDLAVSSLNHKVFMSLLPNDGALAFFLPYIERCCLRLEASKLRSSIAADLIAKTEMTDVPNFL